MKRLLLIFLFLPAFFSEAQPTMTFREVYDFNIGDIFITQGWISSGPPQYNRTTITNKYYSASLDTVFYVYDLYTYGVCGPPPCNPTIHSYWGLVMNYTHLDDTVGAGLGLMPQYINGGPCVDTTGFTGTWSDTSFYDTQFCNILTTRIHWVDNGPYFIDTCMQCFECWPGYRDYGIGVGEKYYIYDQGASAGPVSQIKLIWYEKGSDSCGIMPTVMNISVNELKNYAVTLSPNPAHDKLHIESNLQNAELKIYDVTGREVYSTTLTTKHETLNLSLSPALYFVRVASGAAATAVQKLVIE